MHSLASRLHYLSIDFGSVQILYTKIRYEKTTMGWWLGKMYKFVTWSLEVYTGKTMKGLGSMHDFMVEIMLETYKIWSRSANDFPIITGFITVIIIYQHHHQHHTSSVLTKIHLKVNKLKTVVNKNVSSFIVLF